MKYFGTDGIRDRIDGPLLDPSFVYRLGQALGKWLNQTPSSASKHVIIGRDTRSSAGYLFLSLARGLHKEGVRIFDGGACPTPAIAHAIRLLGTEMGIVITASHNPATDNGIKLFGPNGIKLRPSQEENIEAMVDAIPEQQEDTLVAPPVRYFESRRHYMDTYADILQPKALMGMRIVLDCANGSTYRTSPELLKMLGAQVICNGIEPDGTNINEGVGSEHPELISRIVMEQEADLGIAHDGDGDRVILCDHEGNVVDGDAVLAILGAGWARRGRLKGDTIVATIMSNLGLDKCLADAGVSVERVGVGDRQVFYAMQENGYILGGESSGHFIAMEHLPTGDGLLAALLILDEMIHTGKSLKELASIFRPFPQIKSNLPVRAKPALESIPELQQELADLESELGKRGRILLRYSGTEPKIRLLSEAEDETLARKTFSRLEEIVRRHLPLE
ncbi:MAG: phosphoglucosamine mutase [Puniceicoccaceae bacterium]